MELVTLYLATAAIFLILDAVMLNALVAPLFRKYLGAIMLKMPRVGPAAVFYL